MYEYCESHVLPEGKCRYIIKLLHGLMLLFPNAYLQSEIINKALTSTSGRKEKKKEKRETIKHLVAPRGKTESGVESGKRSRSRNLALTSSESYHFAKCRR